MITVEKVSKFFGSFKALKEISFEIKSGEIVGFLGQNGAGKTTLMRILTTYLQPTVGKATVGGIDVLKDSWRVRKIIGYLPETPPLYPHMLVKDYLKFAAELKDVPAKEQPVEIDRVLECCDIADVKNKPIGILSKGYKQRVGIAQAIIHDPQVLILDEPTNGLDPVQILQVRALIKNLEYKRTVIISTHILPEIEQIAKRVLVIKAGAIVADDYLENLMAKTASKNLEEVFLKYHHATVLAP